MPDHEPAADETAALRARISALSAASLRISASLDLEMVLNEVVESARALTGARYGAIATIDEAGAPQDFVTSGFTADEHRHIVEWPDGPRLFEFFRDLPGPLRIPDVPAYVRALGFSPDDRLPSKTFQGTPMRHRGVHVGNFYLVEKAGDEAFTDEDEEILVLFAAQAATAIANARTYPDSARQLAFSDFWDGLDVPAADNKITIAVEITDFEGNLDVLAVLTDYRLADDPQRVRLVYEFRSHPGLATYDVALTMVRR